MTATFVGHYPWFYTYNFLNEQLPQAFYLITSKMSTTGNVNAMRLDLRDCVCPP